MIQALAASIRGLAGPDLAVALCGATGPLDRLWPDEQTAMVRAVPSRIAEFTAGRTAARAAMQALGLPKKAIPMGRDRAPVWPDGVVGSISHSDGICVAVVARAGAITAIGVDLEPLSPMAKDLWPDVCGAVELSELYGLPELARGPAAKLIFSAKECTYKCIYPQIQTVLGFDALEIALNPAHGTFNATLLQPAGLFAAGTSWRGGYALVQGMIVTVLILRESH